MANPPLFHIRCLLEEVSPPIWRSMQLPGWLTFRQLGVLIDRSLDWTGTPDGGGSFEIAGMTLTADAPLPDNGSDGWKLHDVCVPGLRFLYRPDHRWAVGVQVAAIAEQEPGMTYPVCIGGERAAPPQEVEGPSGYARMLRNPRQRGLWNPERFDVEAVSQALREAAAHMKPIRTPRRPPAEASLPPEGPGAFLRESDVQFDLHAYYLELENAYWREPTPASLREAVSALHKDDLVGLCMVYGIAAEPTMRRLQLDALLLGQLPEAIRLQVPYMDDRQYGLIRQVVDSPEGAVRFARAEMVFSPYELYYFRDRLLLFPRMNGEEPELYMLPEVREALRLDPMQSLSRTQLQNANRRRIIAGMFQYYGVMTMEELQVLLSEMLDETVDLDTVIVDVQELQDFNDAVTIGETLVMHTSLDPQKAEEIWFRQSMYPDLPYRRPSLETLDLAGDWMFVEATNEAEILISFLESRYGLNTGAAEGVAWELMHRFRWGESLEQSLTLAQQTLTHPDTAAQKRFAELVADLWLHAPAWRYKGWAPADVRAMEMHPERQMSWLSMEPDEYQEAIRLISEGEGTVPFSRDAGGGAETGRTLRSLPSAPGDRDEAKGASRSGDGGGGAEGSGGVAQSDSTQAPGPISGAGIGDGRGKADGAGGWEGRTNDSATPRTGRVLSFPANPRKPKKP